MSQKNPAPGGPGIEPRWTRGAKDAVGTAYAVSSRVWFTLANGVLTEVYYPTIDTPQIRDFQFMVTDGETFFHDERRQMISTLTDLGSAALGVKVVNQDPEHRYTIEKEIIGDPHLSLRSDPHQAQCGARLGRKVKALLHLCPAPGDWRDA